MKKCVSDTIKALTWAAKELTSRSDLWSLLVKRMFCSWLVCSSFSIRSICSSADFFSALNEGSIFKILGDGLPLVTNLKCLIDLGFQLLLSHYNIIHKYSSLFNHVFQYNKNLEFYSEVTTIFTNTSYTESVPFSILLDKGWWHSDLVRRQQVCLPVNYWAVNSVTTNGAQKGVICWPMQLYWWNN